jgi:DNA-binding transcriptional MerR regulator
MNINEAERLTGIAKRTIRYYEEARLLSVERDRNTGYRIYKEEDIDILRKIKLYRNIGIPIREIRAAMGKAASPSEPLLKRLQELDSQISSLQMKKELLLSLLNNDRLQQAGAELIYDMEDIIYCNSARVRDKLLKLDRQTIVSASLGASPQVNEFLQELMPERNIKEEQNKLGRVRLEDVEEAQVKLIIHMNGIE